MKNIEIQKTWIVFNNCLVKRSDVDRAFLTREHIAVVGGGISCVHILVLNHGVSYEEREKFDCLDLAEMRLEQILEWLNYEEENNNT